MLKLKNYIGIDVSKSWLDFAIVKANKPDDISAFKVPNSKSEIYTLEKSLIKRQVRLNGSSLFVLEHTGVYKCHIVKFLSSQRSLLCVEDSARIKKSIGIQRGKNDKIDARRIALYAMTNKDKLRFWVNPRKQVILLKDLLINRGRIVRARNALEKPIKEFEKFYLKKDIKYLKKLNKPVIDALDNCTNGIKAEINKIIREDKKIERQMKLLLSIPGIGEVTALNLICSTNEFTRYYEAKKLACYIGVAPFEHSSGSSVKGKTRVSQIANKNLKRLFHLGAMSQIKKNTEYFKYYSRKVAEGKPKMSVINAIRNKIVCRVTAVIKRGTPYIKGASAYARHLKNNAKPNGKQQLRCCLKFRKVL